MVNHNMNNMNRSNGGCNSCKRNDKSRAMCSIYELGFVLTEAMLYLDTHPDDQEAIDYYANMKEKYKDAVDKYSNYYGPVNMTNMTNENYWMWVATPMPWEMEDC